MQFRRNYVILYQQVHRKLQEKGCFQVANTELFQGKAYFISSVIEGYTITFINVHYCNLNNNHYLTT